MISVRSLLRASATVFLATSPLLEVETLAQQRSADASQSQPTSGGLEEVVVTARKRSENVVDVPLSISVFSQEYIERTGMNSVTDLANQTPGLSFRPAFGRVGPGQGGGSSNRPTMRGQSNILGLPNVGFFVDGVYVSGNITSYQLDNVERIEVIRGPQAALFGRGTFAGAVNFVTRKPGEAWSGKVEGTLGVNRLTELNGYVSGPLIAERLRGELNLRYYDRGGDCYNRASRRKDGGEESTRNIGVKLYWTPNEKFDLELNAGYSKDVDGTFAAIYTGINCFEPVITGTIGGVPRSATRSRGYYCGEVDVSNRYDFFSRTDVLRGLGFHGVDRETVRASVKANYDISDWTLTAIGAYNRFRNENAFDNGMENDEATLRPATLAANQDRRKDWSMELRFESPTGGPVHGLAGAYYYRENDLNGNNGVFTLPMTGGVPLGSRIVTVSYNPTQDDSSVRNWSIFGLLEFEPTQRLNLTAEARYQVDTIVSDQNTATNIAGRTNVLLKNDFKRFLPRATALFRWNDRWNVFANVALGNKPGNFNRLPADASPASIADLRNRFQTYDEETAWTYEVGLKGGSENRKLSASLSAYLIDWSSQQLTQPFTYVRANGAPNATTAIVNAGKTRIHGLEIDVNARPTGNVTLRLAYSFVDSEIRDFLDQETEDIYDTDGRVGTLNPGNDRNGQTAGAQLPQSPRHQIILSGDYKRPVTERLEGFIRADLAYESRRYDQVHNLAYTDASRRLNLRTGIGSDNWMVTLWIDNALDDRTAQSLTRLVNFSKPLFIPSLLTPATTNQFTLYRDIMATLPRKRSYGLTASYKF